jgi:hypothetical protein
LPYESARDLPTYVELSQQLTGMRLFRFLLPKDKRGDLRKIEDQLRHLADTVDEFYRVLGPRNWVFHDDFNVERMNTLLESGDVDAVERALIGYYQEEDTLRFMVMRLNGLDDMRSRRHLIDHALNDYREGRFYAVVLVLLTVMDGFVNDVEPSVRRGLHAREANEMDAWDSVVGHHQGLSAAHDTFRRSFKASSAEKVVDLYRNGIIHGNLLAYDNEIVATKAWNRLFAVTDWARAEAKRAMPQPEPTSWRDIFASVAANARTKAALDAFSPRVLTPDQAEFTADEAYQACLTYLSAWQRTNYGAMALGLSHMIARGYGAQAPRFVREEYTGFSLDGFEITSLDFTAAAVCIAAVVLTINNGEPHHAQLRWLHEDEEGDVSPVGMTGEWRLMSWGPHAILSEAGP